MMKKVSLVGVLFMVLVMLLGMAHETSAVPCDPIRLSPCLDAIVRVRKPTVACCNGLKGQEECFCRYMNNPIYRPYINTPGAQAVANACGVTIPATCS